MLHLNGGFEWWPPHLFNSLFKVEKPTNRVPYYRILPVDPEIDPKRIENDFLSNGIRLYHSRRFTTRAQPDASSGSASFLSKGINQLWFLYLSIDYNSYFFIFSFTILSPEAKISRLFENEHFALKVTKQQKNLSYILFSYFARSLDFCQKMKLSNHDTFFWIFVFWLSSLCFCHQREDHSQYPNSSNVHKRYNDQFPYCSQIWRQSHRKSYCSKCREASLHLEQ